MIIIATTTTLVVNGGDILLAVRRLGKSHDDGSGFWGLSLPLSLPSLLLLLLPSLPSLALLSLRKWATGLLLVSPVGGDNGVPGEKVRAGGIW